MIRKSKIKQIEKGVERPSRPEKFKGMLRYKKISGGVHRHSNGQIVRKGEILYAHPEELSPILAVGFKCLDEAIKEAQGIQLGIKDRGNGWYDVINKKTGEVLNDSALRAKDARQFITGDEDVVTPEEVEEDFEEDED